MRIFFSVGEPSGDQHAGHLIREIQRRRPDVDCVGFGGPLMAAAGCDIHFQLTDMAVMGVTQVAPLLGKFYRLAQQAGEYFRNHRPDAVVLVDFPGFNWWIARKAKACGIPVYYYCPPQLWAWASWRIRKVRRLIDHLLCPLQFEADWYQARGVSAECVGHPFFDEIHERQLDDAFMGTHTGNVANGSPLVGILPGSRRHEVLNNFPIQLQVAAKLHQQTPGAKFLVACFKQSQFEFCRQHLEASKLDLPLELCLGRTPEIIEAADACLMVSGSVSLELLARNTPGVVLYHCGPLFYLLGALMVTCKYMSLPNLIADRPLMPEFIVRGNPAKSIGEMTNVLGNWLTNPAELQARRDEMTALAREVVGQGATTRAADAILSRLASPARTVRKAA
jgi:lipid-A-disaccharide synthase